MTDETPIQTTVVTVDTPPDPTYLIQLATGYWASATLLAANDVGLFAALSGEPQTAAQVAAAVAADARATEMLLDACCGLNLLVKQGDRYMLTSAAAAFLTPGRPGYLGSALQWARDQYAAWGRLAETVRSGRPAVDPQEHLGADPEQTRIFVLGMQQRAAGLAQAVVSYLDLEGCETLLDVGGGPGTYACLLTKRYPGLRATVLDLPGIVSVAAELIAEQGATDRVSVLGGDASTGEYGESYYDAVLFSGVLHQMNAETIRRMLQGAHRAMLPGGRLLVSDIMSDATRTQPVFSTLFGLQMLLTSEAGGVFSAEECEAWLLEAGFHDPQIRRLPEPLPYTVVTARK